MFTAITHSHLYVLDQDAALDFSVGKLGFEVNADVGLGFIVTTDDVWKTYRTLKDRGVELTEEPEERSYGIDFGLRDPFGNSLRSGQITG